MDFKEQIELTKEYIEASTEFLNELDTLLLQFEEDGSHEPDEDLLAQILSALHTFKGNSGMMGFAAFQKYAHKLEDLFKGVQAGSIRPDDGLIEFLMKCAGALRRAISNIVPEDADDKTIIPDLQALELFISQKLKPASEQTTSKSAAPIQSAAPQIKKTNILKVEFERLDQLLNLVSELVICRTRLGKIDTQFKESYGERGVGLDLSATSEQIGKVTTELHEAIMRVRMLPIKHVLMRFPRFVRDMAREHNKEIAIEFEGEETELDKTVIDEIGDPLIHLLRNAIDHGIEKPDDRERAGKNRQGSIMMKVYQESSHIFIIVEDDGRGINEEEIRKRAGAAGLMQKEDATRSELLDLIFVPGFSTAKSVTEVSGRGLGMDAVKKSLAKISGSIDVESEPGMGTRFTIKLPLTLAIISTLMVRASGEQYAIPLSSIVESIKLSPSDIHLVNNREVANIRDKVIPLHRLSDVFGLPSSNGKARYAVIVQTGGRHMGIMVDSLLGQQEIVIKALDEYLGKAEGVAGATILGDGKVVLIVDPPAIMQKSKRDGLIEKNSEAPSAE